MSSVPVSQMFTFGAAHAIQTRIDVVAGRRLRAVGNPAVGTGDEILRDGHVDDGPRDLGELREAPGTAVVGECGAGLSAGVLPSA